MANQSEKKNVKNMNQKGPIFLVVLVVCTLIGAVNLGYLYYNDNDSYKDYILFCLYLIINIYCYQSIVKSMALGLSYS